MAKKSAVPIPEQRVRRFITDKQLVTAGQKLVVAVSGGADSVSLLDILARLRRELGIELHVAHLNHRLRGEQSDADARYVAELANQLGIPATVASRDVAAYQKKHKLSPEEAESWILLGKIENDRENVADAYVAYRRAAELAPDQIRAVAGLALAADSLGFEEEAEEAGPTGAPAAGGPSAAAGGGEEAEGMRSPMAITQVVSQDLNETWWELLRYCLLTGYRYTITRGSHNEGKERRERDAPNRFPGREN